MPVKRSRKLSKPLLEEKAVAQMSVSQYPIKDKLRQPKIFVPFLIIILALVLFYFKGLFVAAIVNGTPISRFAVTSELEKKDGKQVLSSLVAQTLITQEAQKRHVNITQKEIDDSVKKIEEGLKAQGQSLEQALSFQGMTKKDFLKQIKTQNLIEKMFSKDIKVTDKEIADYIGKNKDSIPADLKPEDFNSQVKQQLEQQKLSENFQKWLAEAQKNAKIQYFVSY